MNYLVWCNLSKFFPPALFTTLWFIYYRSAINPPSELQLCGKNWKRTGSSSCRGGVAVTCSQCGKSNTNENADLWAQIAASVVWSPALSPQAPVAGWSDTLSPSPAAVPATWNQTVRWRKIHFHTIGRKWWIIKKKKKKTEIHESRSTNEPFQCRCVWWQQKLPVGLQLHPAQLHAHWALCIVGLVWDGGAEGADSGGGHCVIVSSDGRRSALVGGVSFWICVVVHVLLLGWVALWGQTEVRPQL